MHFTNAELILFLVTGVAAVVVLILWRRGRREDPSETAICLFCESVVSKSRMYKDHQGWFCNQEEAQEYFYGVGARF